MMRSSMKTGPSSEHYTYDVSSSGQYRMLYRVWEAPVTLNTSTEPYIRLVSVITRTGDNRVCKGK